MPSLKILMFFFIVLLLLLFFVVVFLPKRPSWLDVFLLMIEISVENAGIYCDFQLANI